MYALSPFLTAKVYCCVGGAEERLVGTTPTAKDTIHPDWAQLCRQDRRGRHVFRLCSLQELLQWEARRRDDPVASASASVHSQQQQQQGGSNSSSRKEQQYEQLLQDDESSVRSSHDLLLFQELRKSAVALQQPQVHRLVAGAIALAVALAMSCGCLALSYRLLLI